MQSLPSIEIIAISLKLIVFALNHDSHCKDMFILKAFTCSGWGWGGGGGGGGGCCGQIDPLYQVFLCNFYKLRN